MLMQYYIDDCVPCLIRVTHYLPLIPMRVTGWGYGDAEPPEPEELDYQIEDPERPGKPCAWREHIATPEERAEIELRLILFSRKRHAKMGDL